MDGSSSSQSPFRVRLPVQPVNDTGHHGISTDLLSPMRGGGTCISVMGGVVGVHGVSPHAGTRSHDTTTPPGGYAGTGSFRVPTPTSSARQLQPLRQRQRTGATVGGISRALTFPSDTQVCSSVPPVRVFTPVKGDTMGGHRVPTPTSSTRKSEPFRNRRRTSTSESATMTTSRPLPFSDSQSVARSSSVNVLHPASAAGKLSFLSVDR